MLMKSPPRIALYGRHSTAMQTATSSADQAAPCMKLVDYLGGTVVATYLDPEQSGYRRNRTGLMKMLRDIETGAVDMVVCEALDRLVRDAEDVAFPGKKLVYHRVALHTVSEGHVDEIKFAVAGLLGAIFLKHLIDKTARGMEAAVLAGRFAGGRAYAYKRVISLDARGELIRGLLEIDEDKAPIVDRIFAEFAAGASSIQIATGLNADGIPGPRGGQWNASTIRGDPKKATGILNNPLYVGRLVWGRRQWRRNPDSEKRERRYRLRDRSEWVEVAVPDLRIVADEQWEAVQTEIERRRRPNALVPVARQNRKKHLLSGLIRCSCCGSGYTITGKDYYRCAGQKERGTCSNTVSVRKGPLETAALSVLQHHLLTEDHAQLFAEEFRREMARLADSTVQKDQASADRLAVVSNEIDNLAANMLTGVLSPTLIRLLGDREAEKDRLEMLLTRNAASVPTATVLPHPALLRRFEEKVGKLRETLDDEPIRGEAAEIISTLIESVTIYPDGEHGPEAEVVAKVADLLTWATNDNAAPKGGVVSSTAVVAGTGFEPVTFRL
ncbi:recombinase family protein [Sphingomonas radiodurans]|uniref:recombinase family protein n=1 Tax=Sphingomonas radiodurans TaxID=2890321 RepID=UPI0038CDBFA7